MHPQQQQHKRMITNMTISPTTATLRPITSLALHGTEKREGREMRETERKGVIFPATYLERKIHYVS